MRSQLPTTTLLSNSYLIFNKLDAYLSQVLDVEGSSKTQYNGFSPGNNDSPAYRRLLDDTYIATNREPGSRMRYEASYCGMDEVDNLLSIFGLGWNWTFWFSSEKAIKRAQSLLFQTHPMKHNILKAGYRMVGLDSLFFFLVENMM